MRPQTLMIVLATLLGAGCGSPDVVTIVDPNTNASPLVATSGAPFEQFGADAAHRSLALALARGRLAQIASVATTQGSDEATIGPSLRALRDEASRALLPRLQIADAQAAAALERSLQTLPSLAGQAPAAVQAAGARAGADLRRAEQALLPAAAWDPTYHTGVLLVSLQELALRYQSVAAGPADPLRARGYEDARALLLDMRRAQVGRIAPAARRPAADRLARLERQAFAAPLLPGSPAPAAAVEEAVGAAADEITTITDVDSTLPAPTRAALGQLASLRALVRRARSQAADKRVGLVLQLRTRHVPAVASSVAAVDPLLLEAIDNGLLTAQRELTRGLVSTPTLSDVEADVARAYDLVRQELKLLEQG